MSEKTHWLQSPNKNYLGHWDLPECGEMVVTIESAQWEAVKNPITNQTESKRVVRFEGGIKPLICNQTNAQSIVRHTGVKWMEDSAGQEICLHMAKHLDRRTKDEIDCIRIKAKPSTPEVNTDDLRALFEQKAPIFPPDKIEAAQDAMASSDPTRKAKLYTYLKSL